MRLLLLFRSDKWLWTDGELAGLVLNVTALFALSVLVLVTCGATYCNSHEGKAPSRTTQQLARATLRFKIYRWLYSNVPLNIVTYIIFQMLLS